MKNKSIRSASAIFAAAALTFLPGCDNGNGSSIEFDSEKAAVSVVRDSFNQEIEALRSEKFDNLSFENLKTFSFPNVSEVTAYKVTKFDDGGGLSPERFFENFADYCEYFAPGKFSKDEIAEKCEVQGNFNNPAYKYYNYSQFKEINKDGSLKIGYMSLETPEFYLAYFGKGVPYWYNGGAMKNRDKADSDFSPVLYTMINDSRPIVHYTENVNSTDVYRLTDGDISIADAAKKANELLADIAKRCDDGVDCPRQVCAVKVVDIGDECYGYSFTTAPVVDGISYAYADMRNDSGGSGYFSTEDGGCGSSDNADMIRSDEICTFTNSGGWKEKTAVKVHDSIITLKAAVNNVAWLLSGEMSFKAKSVTLVYDIEAGSNDLVPCWRFVFENSSPEKYYHVYVNAITGEPRVKGIQEINGGYEYD